MSENNKKRKVSFLGVDKKECLLKEEEMRPPVNVPSNTFICPAVNISIRPSVRPPAYPSVRPPVCSPVIQTGKKVKIESEVWFDNNKPVAETKKK
jgi:hypothetical protein